MSKTSFADFVGKLNTDGALRSALSERFGDLSGDIPAGDLLGFAGEQGYEFSVEEVEQELSDDALENVAGGVYVFPKIDAAYRPNLAFEEIKVTYSARTLSFSFLKID